MISVVAKYLQLVVFSLSHNLAPLEPIPVQASCMIVDRIEGDWAVVEVDVAYTVDIPVELIGGEPVEGGCVRITADPPSPAMAPSHWCGSERLGCPAPRSEFTQLALRQ